MSQTPVPTPASAELDTPENDKRKIAANPQAVEAPVREVVPVTASIVRIAPSLPPQPFSAEPIFHRRIVPALDPYDIDIDRNGCDIRITGAAPPAQDLNPRFLSRPTADEYSWWELLFDLIGLGSLFKPKKNRAARPAA